MVELVEAGKGTFRLERYAIEPLPKDTVTDGNIANLDQVSDALKRGWKRLGSRNRNVAMALPAAMVITKKIIVPVRPEGGGARAHRRGRGQPVHTVRARRGQPRLPDPRAGANNPDEVEVLIAASRKEKVEDRVAIAEAAGPEARG